MSTNETYVLASSAPFALALFNEFRSRLPSHWVLINRPDDLTLAYLESLQPRYVFFPHWSFVVPKEIHERFECVAFHASDLPHGRGGTPLQNLIQMGHSETMLTALRMTAEKDAGPVYCKVRISLEGLAEEIYLRLSRSTYEMVVQIVTDHPTPKPQEGEPVVFRHRLPEESRIPFERTHSVERMFDFVRMLDASGYPRAFLEVDGFRFEFSRPALRIGAVEADVRITRIPAEKP